MKRLIPCALFAVLVPATTMAPILHARVRGQSGTDSKTLVYADFERTENNHPPTLGQHSGEVRKTLAIRDPSEP